MQGDTSYQNKELLKFTLSLILASLSVNLMFITDRMVLGSYSLDSMNAASLGGNFVATVTFIFTCIANISTVFVGQYNGIKEYHKVARAPWQMIYLGIVSFVFFGIVTFFCDKFNIFPNYLEEEGLMYTRILLSLAGLHVISIALASFFIGRKHSYIVICVFVIGNIINAILDYALVFGIDGVCPSMGAKGAAIATVTIELLFTIIFGVVFFNKHNRYYFKTLDYKFRPKLFLDCLKIGFPISIGKFFNLLGWFLIMTCFINVSKDIATLESFIMGVWMAFIFFADGTSRAIAALSSNLIGERKLYAIKTILNKFIKANMIFSAIYAIPLVIFPDIMVDFLSKSEGNIDHLVSDIHFTLISMFIVLITDSIFYLFCGVLSSGGDTKFPTCLENATLWVLVVIPVAVMYWTDTLTSIRPAYTLLPITGVINCIVIYKRYGKLQWYKQLVKKDNSDLFDTQEAVYSKL